MLTTLLKPAEGSGTVFGLDTAARPMRVRRLIGYVPQLLSADGSLTGRENVELFARLFDVPRRERRGRVGEVLTAMGLDDAAGRLVRTYSGGMVRRLELAQALVNAPRRTGFPTWTTWRRASSPSPPCSSRFSTASKSSGNATRACSPSSW
jgi:ABC-2 type transport system ATP-binding protein